MPDSPVPSTDPLSYRSGTDDAAVRRFDRLATLRASIGSCLVLAPLLFISVFIAVMNNITAGPPHIQDTYETQRLAYLCPAAVLVGALVWAGRLYRRDRPAALGILAGLLAAVLLHVALFAVMWMRSGPPPTGILVPIGE